MIKILFSLWVKVVNLTRINEDLMATSITFEKRKKTTGVDGEDDDGERGSEERERKRERLGENRKRHRQRNR